jgi:hypothetical protein
MSILRLPDLKVGGSACLPQAGVDAERVNPHEVESIPQGIGSRRPSTQYNPQGG